jgi:hypothetical protein
MQLVRGLAVAGLLVAAVAAAGCGGGSGAASASASADDKRETARLKLSQCLREQGVDVPDAPGAGSSGAPVRVQLSAADRKKLQAAMQGPCKSYQAAAFGNVTPEQRQEFQDAFTKFAACMRQHGVDLPDPPAGGGARGAPAAGARRIDDSDPKTKAAMTACQDKLPRNGPGARIGAGGGPR